MTRFSKKAQKKIAEVMHELEDGKLMSPEDKPITSHKRAHSIALHEARKVETKVIKKKPHRAKKSD